MKADLDRLMAERDLAALMIPIDHIYSPYLDYLVGSVKLTGGLAIKQQGRTPILVVNGMEVEEAGAAGVPVHTIAQMGYYDFYKEAGGDPLKTLVGYWPHVLSEAGIAGGRIGVYGVGDLHGIIAAIEALRTAGTPYTFVGEIGNTLFTEAAITKDAGEIARIVSVAERTSDVLQATWDYIAGHGAQDGTVVDADGQPLTIGAVKGFVRRALLDRGLEDTGMIFAQGRDAGYPHSRGQADMALRTGESIVFDLFPRELGGGYHHDVTRTWCIGQAPDAVQAAYDQVMTAFDISIEAYGKGKPTHLMQEAVLDYFEAQGHPTSRSSVGTEAGYVHSLGHGIGLHIHEAPSITHLKQEDHFAPGQVITIEPGLYYPERGFGVRVEDALYIDEAGELVTLTDFRKDLVLPLNG